MDRLDMMFKLLRDLNEKFDEHNETLTRVETGLKHHVSQSNKEDIKTDKDITDMKVELGKKVDKPTLKQIGVTLGILGSIVGIAVSLKVL